MSSPANKLDVLYPDQFGYLLGPILSTWNRLAQSLNNVSLVAVGLVDPNKPPFQGVLSLEDESQLVGPWCSSKQLAKAACLLSIINDEPADSETSAVKALRNVLQEQFHLERWEKPSSLSHTDELKTPNLETFAQQLHAMSLRAYLKTAASTGANQESSCPQCGLRLVNVNLVDEMAAICPLTVLQHVATLPHSTMDLGGHGLNDNSIVIKW